MGFPRGRTPAPARIRGSVFAVGRRVYVACAGDRSARVELTDDTGKTAIASLGDGTEVAIVAWKPGWAGSTQYRVRPTDSDLEGWLAVGNLRGTEADTSPAPMVPPPPVIRPAPSRVGELERRFGQPANGSRRPLGPMPGVSSAPPQPPGGGEVRRRFGQRSD